MNHITIGIYKNGDYKINVVKEEHLEYHIDYNKTMRFGRALFVDGECLNQGYLDNDEVSEWTEKVKDISSRVNILKASETYW